MNAGRYVLALSLLYMASIAAPARAADDSGGKAITIYIAAGKAVPEVSKDERKRRSADFDAFEKDLKKWFRGQQKAYGKEYRKWPAEVGSECYVKAVRYVELLRAVIWADAGSQKDLDDSTADIKNGIAGNSFFAAKKDVIKLVDTPAAAQLVVEVTARWKRGLSGQYVRRFVHYNVSAGGQLPAEVFAELVPGGAGQGGGWGYNADNFYILGWPTEGEAYWMFASRSGDLWSTTGNMVGKHLSELIKYNFELLTSHQTTGVKPRVDYDAVLFRF